MFFVSLFLHGLLSTGSLKSSLINVCKLFVSNGPDNLIVSTISSFSINVNVLLFVFFAFFVFVYIYFFNP